MALPLLLAALRLFLADGALLTREKCEAQILRGVQAGDAEARAGPLRADREQAKVFWALAGHGCRSAYQDWTRARLPAACRAAHADFCAKGVPAPHVALAPMASPAPESARNASEGIAYLISVSNSSSLPLVLRTHARLAGAQDRFLYTVDAAVAPTLAQELRQKLGGPRVEVLEAGAHAGMYYWPRVQNVLDGLRRLSAHRDWTYAAHLSEADYPLSVARIREVARRQDRPVVMDAVPRNNGKQKDDWYWWKERAAVFVCDGHAVPDVGVDFPEDALAAQVSLFRGSEWFMLPREVVDYVVDDPRTADGVASFVDVLQHRWSADEVFWPTLVSNIPGLKREIEPGWYVSWDDRVGHSPDTFTGATLARHKRAILASDRLFLRKVRLPGSKELLDALDRCDGRAC